MKYFLFIVVYVFNHCTTFHWTLSFHRRRSSHDEIMDQFLFVFVKIKFDPEDTSKKKGDSRFSFKSMSCTADEILYLSIKLTSMMFSVIWFDFNWTVITSNRTIISEIKLSNPIHVSFALKTLLRVWLSPMIRIISESSLRNRRLNEVFIRLLNVITFTIF